MRPEPLVLRFRSMTPYMILVVLALIFAIISLIPPLSSWPILPVAVVLIAVAMLISK